MEKQRLVFYIVLSAMLLTNPVFAQVTTGTILGTVTDSSGAPISAATVSILEIDKNTSQQVQTDEAGSYNVPFLIPGNYRVTVEKDGFKKAVSTNIALQVDQKARTDFSLQVGSVSETIEVTAAAPLIRSESAELGEVISSRAVRELPPAVATSRSSFT